MFQTIRFLIVMSFHAVNENNLKGLYIYINTIALNSRNILYQNIKKQFIKKNKLNMFSKDMDSSLRSLMQKTL